jgi:hypothetical protein
VESWLLLLLPAQSLLTQLAATAADADGVAVVARQARA